MTESTKLEEELLKNPFSSFAVLARKTLQK